MNQLEMNETEIMTLALKQLKADGKIPDYPIAVHQYRSTDPDKDGQYTFTYRWKQMTEAEAKQWESVNGVGTKEPK